MENVENCRFSWNFVKNSDFSDIRSVGDILVIFVKNGTFLVIFVKNGTFWCFSPKPMGKPEGSKTVKTPEKPTKPEGSGKVSKNTKKRQNRQNGHFREFSHSFTVSFGKKCSFDQSVLAIRKVSVLTRLVLLATDCIRKKPGERVPGLWACRGAVCLGGCSGGGYPVVWVRDTVRTCGGTRGTGPGPVQYWEIQPNTAKHSQILQNSAKNRAKSGQNSAKLGQIRPSWVKFGQVGSSWVQLRPVGSGQVPVVPGQVPVVSGQVPVVVQ